MLDKDVINAKFDIIQKDLKLAKQLAEIKPTNFQFRDEQAAKYTVLEIAEACIDIANHIIVANGFRRAEEYAELFQVLNENGVLQKSLADRLSSMARVRNILVHRYADVSRKRLIDALKNDLGDITEFMHVILHYVEKGKRHG